METMTKKVGSTGFYQKNVLKNKKFDKKKRASCSFSFLLSVCCQTYHYKNLQFQSASQVREAIFPENCVNGIQSPSRHMMITKQRCILPRSCYCKNYCCYFRIRRRREENRSFHVNWIAQPHYNRFKDTTLTQIHCVSTYLTIKNPVTSYHTFFYITTTAYTN